MVKHTIPPLQEKEMRGTKPSSAYTACDPTHFCQVAADLAPPLCKTLQHNYLRRATLGIMNNKPKAQPSPLSPPDHQKTPNPLPAKLFCLSDSCQSLKTLGLVSVLKQLNNREIEEQLSQLCKGDYLKG